jgi:hypothetical protein
MGMAKESSKQFLRELNNPSAFKTKLYFWKEENSDLLTVPFIIFINSSCAISGISSIQM